MPRPTGIENAEKPMGVYPYEFSGGQCRRAVIVMALANNLLFLITNEPNTAKDVTVQVTSFLTHTGITIEKEPAVLFLTLLPKIIPNPCCQPHFKYPKVISLCLKNPLLLYLMTVKILTC